MSFDHPSVRTVLLYVQAHAALSEVSAATPKVVHAQAKTRIRSLESQVQHLQAENEKVRGCVLPPRLPIAD